MNNNPVVSGAEQTPGLVRVASDELLLLGARLHDDIALGVLFDRYSPEVYALALDVVRDRDAAEAVLQDVFLRCWRGLEIYDASRGTTHDWLLGITRSRAQDTVNALTALNGGEAVASALRSAATHQDTGLLPPEPPASGARERLLARARAESTGLRASEAPTVVIPAAELASDTTGSEAPTLTDLPVLGPPLVGLAPLDAAAPPPAEPEEQDEPITDQAPALVVPASTEAADALAAVPVAPEPVASDPAPGEPETTAPARAEAKTAEVPVSEALAAALAPIPPRRGGRQQLRQAPASETSPQPPARRGIKLASILWAVALLFVIAAGLFVAAWSATGPHVSPDLALLSRLPGGRVLTLRGMGAPNAGARLYSIDSGRRAELAVDGMPALPAGRVYQAWIAEAGQPVRSAGSFLVNRRGDAVVPATVGIPTERIQAVIVTQEAAPSSATPSGPRLLQWAP